jgi:pyruvate formate lyase activating enzyme
VETCGCAPPGVIADLEPLADLFLFDLKVLDQEEHLRCTGQENGLILDNFRRLAGRCPDKLVPRLTVVPGVSDSPRNLSAMADLLRKSRLGSIELLAYHPLGLGKWEELGREPLCRPDPALAGPALDEAARYFARQGIPCSVP